MNEHHYSKLLIPSQPLQVLPELAVAIGLNEAIILQQVHYWLSPDRATGKVVDGKRWIYNTYDGWQNNFPFWSVPTIKRTISSLEKEDLLESRDDLNSHAIDRTKWYTINYEHPILQASLPVIPPSDQNDPSSESKRSALHITETTTESLGKPPRKKKLPENGPAQQIVKAYCDAVGIEQPVSYRKAVGQAQSLATAGITPEDIPSIVAWMKKDAWYRDKMDLGMVLSATDRWRISQPKKMKPASQMTDLDRLRAEYDAYQADTYRNYGPVRVRELNALLRQIQELEAKEQVS